MEVTPEVIRQAYKDAGVYSTETICAGVRRAIQIVEERITQAYTRLPAEMAHRETQYDRRLLRAQLSFLAHLEGKQ